MFFLGDDLLFMISARDFDGCRVDSIYLTGECFCRDDYDGEDNVYGQDAGLYALDECFVVRYWLIRLNMQGCFGRLPIG